MAEQKFSAVQREALWLAHEKKCAYTRELLDLSSMHIDHIVPESLADDPTALANIKSELGVDANFDILGYENLLPCKPVANLQKRSTVFEPARTHFFLGIAASKKSEVEAQIRNIESRRARGRALILLQQGLERGELTSEVVLEILEKYGERPQEIFSLLENMGFVGRDQVNIIAKADIGELRKLPIKFGRNDHIESVTFINDAGREILVKTCTEYDSALETGYYPKTNFDIKMSAFLEHQCGLLRALENARPSQKSFITSPAVAITDLHLMPFNLFPQMGDRIDWKGTTYQDKIDDGTLSVKKIKHNLLVTETSGMGQQLVEVARADFNGDGLDDILLFEYCYAIGGTLGFGVVTILTRKDSTNLFEYVALNCSAACKT